jgi:hypothetical protein
MQIAALSAVLVGQEVRKGGPSMAGKKGVRWGLTNESQPSENAM